MLSGAFSGRARDLKHELRTPLNHIIGYAALLFEAAEDASDAVFARHAKAVQTLGGELNRIIDGVLGQHEPPLSPDDLHHLHQTMQPFVEKLTMLLDQLAGPPENVGYAADLQKIRGAVERLTRILAQPMSSGSLDRS